MYLSERILEIGIENCMFIIGLKPLEEVIFTSYASNDEEETIMLPTKINENRYKIKDNYKITLECIIPGFNKLHLYQQDLKLMLEMKQATMFKKVTI